LRNDRIDCARPGDEIEVTGIYRHDEDPARSVMSDSPVFSAIIDANHVRNIEESYEFDLPVMSSRASENTSRTATSLIAYVNPVHLLLMFIRTSGSRSIWRFWAANKTLADKNIAFMVILTSC
jgi:hypothetical protein